MKITKTMLSSGKNAWNNAGYYISLLAGLYNKPAMQIATSIDNHDLSILVEFAIRNQEDEPGYDQILANYTVIGIVTNKVTKKYLEELTSENPPSISFECLCEDIQKYIMRPDLMVL